MTGAEPNCRPRAEGAFLTLPSGSGAFREVGVSSVSHSEEARWGYWCFSESFASSLIETPNAAEMSRTVAQVGLASPRSMSDRVFGLISDRGASSSWVSPRFCRSSRMAWPSAGCGRDVSGLGGFNV